MGNRYQADKGYEKQATLKGKTTPEHITLRLGRGGAQAVDAVESSIDEGEIGAAAVKGLQHGMKHRSADARQGGERGEIT